MTARGAWLALLGGLVLAPSGGATSTGGECRRACRDEVSACVAAGGRRAACRRDVLGRCRRDGLTLCQSPTDAGSRATGARSMVRPAGLTATASSPSTIDLAWRDTNTRENGYLLERSPDGASFAVVATLPRNAKTYRDASLAAGATYYYRVQAFGRRGVYSAYSNVASATTPAPPDLTPPTVPSGQTAWAVSCSQINVAWNASTDAGGSGLRGYRLYRNGAFLREVPVPATQTTDTGLGASTTQAYAVSAVDNAGNESARSATASAATPACATTTTTVVPTTSTTTTTRPPTTTTTSSTTTTRPSTTTTSTISTTTTRPPTTSTTTVTTTTLTTTTTVAPDGTPPSVPANVSATAASCSQVNVGWNASGDTGGSGLKGYNVYRGGSFLRQVLAPATSTSDTGLAASTVYAYAVSAVDNAGNESQRSATASVNTPACPASLDPTLMGYVPGVGAAKDVVVVGGTAYVASPDFGLALVDVTTPTAPRAMDGALPPFYGERVATSGTLAVVSTSSVGLKVIDLAAAGGPTVVGALGGTMKGVGMTGSYAYVLNVVPGNPAHTDLAVVDLRTPSVPAIVGRVTVGDGAELTVAGGLVYVAGGTGGLQVIDVSSPTAPRVAGAVDTPGSASGVAVANGWAYVADGSAVQVVDVSAPSQPVIRGSLQTSATSVAVAGTRLYAVDGLQLKILDVSSPVVPSLLGTSTAYSAQRVMAVGTMVYLPSANTSPSSNQGGLYVVDASSPTAPRLITNVYGGWDNWSVSVSGTLGVVTGNLLGLKVLDVSDPTAPRPLAGLGGTFKGAALSGSYAYVIQVVPGNPAHTDLVVVDVRTPTAPAIAGRVTVAGGSEVTLVGSLAYVAALGAGLQIVDVSSPSAPRIVGAANTPGNAHAVAVGANGYAYVADETAVVAVDVSNPSAPAVRGSLTTTATAIAVAGTRVYAVDGMQLKILDVSSPAAPSLLSTTTGYGAQAVDATGTTVMLSTPAINHLDTSGGVYVLDATSATSPRLVRQVIVPGTTRSVRAVGSGCYAGDAAALIDVIHVAQ